MECKNKTQVILDAEITGYKSTALISSQEMASLFKDNPISLECGLSEGHSSYWRIYWFCSDFPNLTLVSSHILSRCYIIIGAACFMCSKSHSDLT